MRLQHIPLNKILFLDIETVPAFSSYDELPTRLQKAWNKKSEYIIKDSDTTPAEAFEKRGGIYAEFGKIVTIAVGLVNIQNGEKSIRLKSFTSDDERQLLLDFKQLLDTHYHSDNYFLCAHNGKEFDFPYIARRMLINRIELPHLLDIAGKKPWEIQHLDTLELWKFGDYKHYTSLELLAALFNIPSPKDDIDGSEVASVYYNDKNLDRISQYCQKDVKTLINLFLSYRGEDIIND